MYKNGSIGGQRCFHVIRWWWRLVVRSMEGIFWQKNSDRPTGEPQPLCYYEGKEYEEGAVVQTTHLTIPQVRKTYAVVGSRPYWIWGFEMGYNEKGLVIGNDDWGESETSASLLAYYDEKIGIIGRYAPVQPCLSAYIPVYMTGKLPEKMERAEKRFDEESLWWQVKRLSLLVTVDERIYMDEVRAKLQALEIQFTKEGEKAEDEARQLIDKGMQDEAKAVLFSVTEKCTEMLYDFAKAEGKRIANSIQAKGRLYGRQKEAIEKYVAYAEIPLFYER